MSFNWFFMTSMCDGSCKPSNEASLLTNSMSGHSDAVEYLLVTEILHSSRTCVKYMNGSPTRSYKLLVLTDVVRLDCLRGSHHFVEKLRKNLWRHQFLRRGQTVFSIAYQVLHDLRKRGYNTSSTTYRPLRKTLSPLANSVRLKPGGPFPSTTTLLRVVRVVVD